MDNTASRVQRAILLILLSPILIIAVSIYLAWGLLLYVTIWLTRRKPFVVFVYSESPTWKDHIENEFLPRLQGRAVILNWSKRRHWKSSLAVLAFRYFGGYRNFNPIGMVFHPFRLVKTYRFFKAFQAFKHGDPAQVQDLKNALFEDASL